MILLCGPLGLPIERDPHFDADKTLSAYAEEAREHARIVTSIGPSATGLRPAGFFVESHHISQNKKAPLAGPPSASNISATGNRQAALSEQRAKISVAANVSQLLGRFHCASVGTRHRLLYRLTVYPSSV